MNWIVTYHVGTDDEYTVPARDAELAGIIRTMIHLQDTLQDGEGLLIRKADYLVSNARKRHLRVVP